MATKGVWGVQRVAWASRLPGAAAMLSVAPEASAAGSGHVVEARWLSVVAKVSGIPLPLTVHLHGRHPARRV